MIFPSLLLFCLGMFQRKLITTCALINSPKEALNSIDINEEDLNTPNNDDVVLIPEKSFNLDPNDPLSSINIDYMKNAVILQFRRNPRFPPDGISGRNDWDMKRRLDSNFMRFGRSNDNDNNNGNLMRFGKRQLETYADQKSIDVDEAGNRHERSNGGSSRDSRGDNFMRFGRSDPQNFMRFGRSDNLMRFGRPDNLMRFGRPDNLMRFGRPDNLMRFGRPDNLMRFGRPDNLMRFGRPDNLMRFGRPDHLMRFGRNDKNFVRFGKLDQNFMRFGKRSSKLFDKLNGNKNDIVPNSLNLTDKTKISNDLDALIKPHSNNDLTNLNDLDFDENLFIE